MALLLGGTGLFFQEKNWEVVALVMSWSLGVARCGGGSSVCGSDTACHSQAAFLDFCHFQYLLGAKVAFVLCSIRMGASTNRS